RIRTTSPGSSLRRCDDAATEHAVVRVEGHRLTGGDTLLTLLEDHCGAGEHTRHDLTVRPILDADATLHRIGRERDVAEVDRPHLQMATRPDDDGGSIRVDVDHVTRAGRRHPETSAPAEGQHSAPPLG